jgi:hypothetical protein
VSHLHGNRIGGSDAGLPDLSLFNVPKRREMYQIDTKLPNGRNIYQLYIYQPYIYHLYIFQMAIEYTNFFQGPPKFTQIWLFWFENIPSGNPGAM